MATGDPPESDASGSQTDAQPTPEPSPTTTGADETTTAADDSTGSTGPGVGCGNGIVDPGEACDDDSAECRSDCQLACTLATVVLGEGNAAYEGVALDPEGNPVAVGVSRTEPDAGDALIAYLTPDGVETERVLYDQFGEENEARAVTVAPDGEVSIVVVSRQPGMGSTRQVDLVRFAGSASQWQASAGEFAVSSSLNVHPDVAPLADGGVAVVTTYETQENGHQFWFGRYTAEGMLASTTITSAPGDAPWDDQVAFMVADEAGRLTAAGTRASEQGGLGVRDPVVTQVGPDGGESWSWSEWTGATNLFLLPVGAAVDGTGRTALVFAQSHGSPSSNHYAIWVFEPDGALAWALDTNDLDDDARFAGTIAFDASGRLFVLGIAVYEGNSSDEFHWRTTAFDGEGDVLCDTASDEGEGQYTDAVVDAAGDVLAVGTRFESQNDSQTVFTRIRGFD